MKSGLFYSVLTALLFITHEPVSKLIAEDVTPYAITFWRFAISAVVLLPFALSKLKKENKQVTASDMTRMTLLGILFICISMVVLQIAVKIADNPSLIAIIFSSNSVFSIILAILIVKEKMTKPKFYAIILCTVGVLICADFRSGGTNLASAAMAIFAAVTFSLYSILSQKYMTRLGGSVQMCFVFILGSAVLLAGLLIMGVPVVPQLTARNVLILLYLGLCVTGVGYLSYFKAIEKGGAIMASLAFFIKPVLTPFSTWAINGITPDAAVFAAVLFIVAGSYFAIYRKNKN